MSRIQEGICFEGVVGKHRTELFEDEDVSRVPLRRFYVH